MAATQPSSSIQPQELQEKYILPEYQPTRFALNDKAIDELSTLGQGREWQALEARLQAMRQALPEAAGDLNERLVERKERLEKQRRRRQAADPEADAAEDQKLVDLELSITNQTEKMEAAMRRAIDGSANIDRLRSVLREIQPRSATSATQGSRRTTQDVTQPGATAGDVASLMPQFSEKLDSAKERYEARTLSERYSRNEDYISWKQTIHQAQYPPDQAPEMPDATTWFRAAGEEPTPGATGNEIAGDDDDDVQVFRAKISTKCPITLQEFEEPVQSTKCNHSFEKQAILQLIQQARPDTRHGRSARWVPEVTCPVPGCVQVICKEDLTRNILLERKIKRIQRMKETEQQQAIGDAEAAHDVDGEELSSGSESGDDIDAVTQKPATQVKEEKLSQRRQRQSQPDDSNEDEDMEDASD